MTSRHWLAWQALTYSCNAANPYHEFLARYAIKLTSREIIEKRTSELSAKYGIFSSIETSA
jgi:hypothetical protein